MWSQVRAALQVGRLNPAELKAQKLARSGVGGGGDRSAKPDVDERRAIQAVLNYPPNRCGCEELPDHIQRLCMQLMSGVGTRAGDAYQQMLCSPLRLACGNL